MTTLARWTAAWAHIGAREEAPALFHALLQAYAEPQRRYHTLAHLQDCLAQFDTVQTLAGRPAEVEIALWFHDAIYDTHAPDNEARSAQWAEAALSTAGVATDVTQRVVALIMATCHNATPVGEDACLLVDVDLSILGRQPEVFDAYERQIRDEYAWVPAATFCQRRAAILEALLARERIYTTPCLQARYEAPARLNLARSIASLRG